MGKPAKKQRALTSTKVDRLKPASVIIDKFGGLTRFCEMTGYKIQTAHRWTTSGYIPPYWNGASRHLHILEVAKANRIKLLPSDFVEVPHVASATGDAAA